MLAIVAAAVFVLAVVLDLLDETLGDVTTATLLFVGLALCALHLAGVGNNWRNRNTS